MTKDKDKIELETEKTPDDVVISDSPLEPEIQSGELPVVDGGENIPAETSKFKDARGGKRNRERRSSRRDARVKPEFDQKIVSLRRVTRVMAGGRRFNFSVALVAGNRKGSVGFGQGKAADTPLAIEKAFRDAKKNMIKVNATKNMSIPHDVEAKYSASWVKIMPARGKGILAGSSARTVLELAGLKEIGAKLLSRSKNSANNAQATIKALKKLESTKLKARHK
jgi:small subunit ribosomal protein S5